MGSSACNIDTQTPDQQQTQTQLAKPPEQNDDGESQFCAACVATSPRSLVKLRLILLGVQVQLQVVGYNP